MTDDVKLDIGRYQRTGLYEAVMCSGKSIAQLRDIVQRLTDAGQSMLFTRLSPGLYAQIDPQKSLLDYDASSHTAVLPASHPARLSRRDAGIAVVTGGTSDLVPAREAVRTLAFHGLACDEIHDVGVAGLWRLQEQLPLLQRKSVIICLAGMDAALPTVLGGLVPALIIAVPVSTGYGVAREGETALNSLLCSCAQGIVVVNIDNGFGAACAAIRALQSSGE